MAYRYALNKEKAESIPKIGSVFCKFRVNTAFSVCRVSLQDNQAILRNVLQILLPTLTVYHFPQIRIFYIVLDENCSPTKVMMNFGSMIKHI